MSERAGELIKRLGPAGVLGVAWALMPLAGSVVLFWNIREVSEFLNGQGVWIYAAAFAVLAGLALLPTYVQAVVGGWAFGLGWGVLGAMLGFAGGAVIGYEIARRVSGDRVEAIIRERPKWRAVRDALIGASPLRTLLIVSLLRLPPSSPFAVTNLVLASVKVPRPVFAAGTLIGMLPRTAAMVYLGTTIAVLSKETVNASRPWWFIASGVVLALAVLLVLSEIGKRAIAHIARPAGGEATGP